MRSVMASAQAVDDFEAGTVELTPKIASDPRLRNQLYELKRDSLERRLSDAALFGAMLDTQPCPGYKEEPAKQNPFAEYGIDSPEFNRIFDAELVCGIEKRDRVKGIKNLRESGWFDDLIQEP